jgi:hypothetical protein
MKFYLSIRPIYSLIVLLIYCALDAHRLHNPSAFTGGLWGEKEKKPAHLSKAAVF